MGFVRRLLALSGVAFFFASCGDDKGSSILDELMLADYVVNGSDDLKLSDTTLMRRRRKA